MSSERVNTQALRRFAIPRRAASALVMTVLAVGALITVDPGFRPAATLPSAAVQQPASGAGVGAQTALAAVADGSHDEVRDSSSGGIGKDRARGAGPD